MTGVLVATACAIAMGCRKVGGFWVVRLIIILFMRKVKHFRWLTQTFRLRIENHEFGSNFGRPFAFEKWHQTAQVFQVKRIANAGAGVLFIVVPDHRAMQPATSRWTGDKVAQRLRIRNGTLRCQDLKYS